MLRVARMGLRYGPCLLISDGGVGEGGRTATVTAHHTFYSSLTFGVIVLHVTLRLIADLSSPFLSLFADWSCLSFLQNVV